MKEAHEMQGTAGVVQRTLCGLTANLKAPIYSRQTSSFSFFVWVEKKLEIPKKRFTVSKHPNTSHAAEAVFGRVFTVNTLPSQKRNRHKIKVMEVRKEQFRKHLIIWICICLHQISTPVKSSHVTFIYMVL